MALQDTSVWLTLICVAFLADFCLSSTEECPNHIKGLRRTYLATHNRTCYLFVNHEVFWRTARDKCLSHGGEMLSVKDEDTMQFIRNTLSSKELAWDREGVWLGARHYHGIWRWSDGERVKYTNWAPGEPSKLLGAFSMEDCAQMRSDNNWQWHDYPCGALKFHYNYVCEFPMLPTTSTTPPATAVVSTSKQQALNRIDERLHRGSDGSEDVLSERLRAEILALLRREGVDLSYNFLHSGLSESALSRPGEVNGRMASSATDQEKDNGYATILAIIGSVSGVFLLIMLVVFLLILRHQRIKRAKLEAQVRFTNTTYEGHNPATNAEHPPLPPLPVSRPPGAKDDLYLTPRDVTDVYSEVNKPEGHLHSLQFRPKPCKCGLVQAGADNSSHCSSPQSSSSLGACGGSDLDHDLRTPLMPAPKVAAGAAAKPNGMCCTCVPSSSGASQVDGYVDMQSLTAPKEEEKTSKEKVDEDKHTYTNVDHKDVAAENHYEVLP